MGTNELRKRINWQSLSGGKADSAEKLFHAVFTEAFKGTNFAIRSKPREFADIYVKVKLSPEVISKIYNPDRTWHHGIIPDYAIDNIETKKTLYVEVKRQDGWVEGKQPSAGRGNAHERSCKLFTPGLQRILKEHGKLGNHVLPFWVVFQGDIARDPKRVREITLWYEGCEEHFFLWHDDKDIDHLIEHFDKNLKKLLL